MPSPFLESSARARCSSYQLRKQLKKFAVRKDGCRENAKDENLVFPPKRVLEVVLTEEEVDKVLRCSCEICRDVIVTEPVNDPILQDNIVNQPNGRVLLAVLIWMGASFAMRLLTSHGLGPDNYNIKAAFAQHENLKRGLFQHLRNSVVDEFRGHRLRDIKGIFIASFQEATLLFTSPKLSERNVKTNFPKGCNLPFLEEEEQTHWQSSAARLYTFRIQEEFCDSAILVRNS
jgi:hypothetical protein